MKGARWAGGSYLKRTLDLHASFERRDRWSLPLTCTPPSLPPVTLLCLKRGRMQKNAVLSEGALFCPLPLLETQTFLHSPARLRLCFSIKESNRQKGNAVRAFARPRCRQSGIISGGGWWWWWGWRKPMPRVPCLGPVSWKRAKSRLMQAGPPPT